MLENLTPVVREEQLLSGENLTPETRLEYFLKQAGDAAAALDILNLAGNDKQHRIIAGAIRNRGSGWEFIVDNNHQADLNAASVSVSGGQIRIDFGFTASKVISFIVTPDETFNNYGYLVGASVAKNLAILEIRQPVFKSVSAAIAYVDGAFQIQPNAKGVTAAEWDATNERLVVTHDVITNNAPLISVEPFRFGKLISAVQTYTGTQTYIKFFNGSGDPVDTPSTSMEILFTRADTATLAYNIVNANNVVNQYANFWFFGIFEVEE